MDMAGNVGTQSLAVTIRVLMDESLTGKQKFELVLKEMKIAFSNGFILGVLSFVLIGLYIALFKGKSFLFAYAVSGCIGASLLLAMVISGAVGTCIPLFFKKIHVDPADRHPGHLLQPSTTLLQSSYLITDLVGSF